jgi:hypothetical protein
MGPGGGEPGPRPPGQGGPLVALCAGRRCTALPQRTGAAEGLRSAVRQTPGAALVTADCLEPCHLASIVVVAHRDGRNGSCGRGTWLTGIDRPARAEALRRWVLEGGPANGSPRLPDALAGAVVTPVMTGPPAL